VACIAQIKAEDCTSGQVYDPQGCKCTCPVRTAACPDPLEWDVDACQCTCPAKFMCKKGKSLDPKSCR